MAPKISSFIIFSVMMCSVVEPRPVTDNSTLQFIRNKCKPTLYPSLCFASLAPYASLVLDHSPIRLCHLAVNVTRARARSLSRHVAFLRKSPLPPGDSKALQDCSETLDDAIGLALTSGAVLTHVEKSGSGGNKAWWVSNVLTWMSAVMTDEETCCDGFDDDEAAESGSEVKADVCGRVAMAEKYCSNALALVNNL